MTDLIIALSISTAVIAYWVACRKRALKYQARAVEMMELYFSEKGVPQDDKDALYKDYIFSRQWYALPICALITPFLLTYMLVKKRKLDITPKKRARNDLYRPAFDQMMKMSLAKNPIISCLSISYIGISFAVAIPIGVMLNRLSSMPTADGIVELLVKFTEQANKKAHLH